MMNIAAALLDWYDNYKRDLPWRQDKDPYKIWVSEVMLQQTRVEEVRPYFERWMERFPNIESLAEAAEDEVIRYWQGLGYYSRARNLHRGVREVSQAYGGRVPDTKEAAMAISGIGDYTAGAIVSIAYNKKEAAIDGNVLRVFSRLYCIDEDISTAAVKRRIKKIVKQEMPDHRPGDFNQALMDLGATICIPKIPRCEECPLQSVCAAKEQGRQRQLPVKKKKTLPLPVRLMAGVLCAGDCFLLRRRADKGILAGMWEFPAVEMPAEPEDVEWFKSVFFQETGQEVEPQQLLLQCTHTFSHRQWNISFYHCAAKQKHDIPAGNAVHWVSKNEWERLSFAGPHRKMADFLKKDGSADG